MKAKMDNFAGWVRTSDKDYLKNTFGNLLKKSNFNILSFTDYTFEPFGYTALWLLAESHLAVHTFPEQGNAYFELSSCNADKSASFKSELRREIGKLLKVERQ